MDETEVVTELFSQIEPKPIRWLWKPWLARGKLAILDGDPGVGKSLLAIDLAARLSRGDDLPDGQKLNGIGTTAFLAAEDDAADTLRPRAEAAGANLDRLVTVAGCNDRPLRIPDDLHQISRHVGHHNADLLVIDPIVAFLPRSVALANDQCVREAMSRLTKIAQGFDCAVLLIRHLRKASSRNALHRGSGSMGFIASCRTGLLAAKDPSDPSRGILAVTKSNLGEGLPALGYRIVTNDSGLATVQWTGPAPLTANDLGIVPRPLSSLDRAAMWLMEQLESGSRPAAEIYAAAASAGIPERTLRRAGRTLGITPQRTVIDGRTAWQWTLEA